MCDVAFCISCERQTGSGGQKNFRLLEEERDWDLGINISIGPAELNAFTIFCRLEMKNGSVADKQQRR